MQSFWRWRNHCSTPLPWTLMQVEILILHPSLISPLSDLTDRTKLKMGRHISSQSGSYRYWMRSKKELVTNLSLCFWEKAAQPFLLEAFIGEKEGKCRHTHTHKNTPSPKKKTNLKCKKGLWRWEQRPKSQRRACKSSATEQQPLCAPCPYLRSANKATAGDLRWCRRGLSDGRGPCKLIHCLIKAISKSIRDLTGRQHIVASPWWEWHVNSN